METDCRTRHKELFEIGSGDPREVVWLILGIANGRDLTSSNMGFDFKRFTLHMGPVSLVYSC